jgi:Ca2+-binding RTX toxin-like protein
MATPTKNTTPTFSIPRNPKNLANPYSGQNNIDSLLSGIKWGNGPVGTGVQGLEYSFVQSRQLINYVPTSVKDENGNITLTGQQVLENFSSLTPGQIAAADAAINAWAEVANINFTPIGDEPNQLVGDINNQLVGDIRFARSNRVNDISTAYSISLSDAPNAGDIWFSTTGNGTQYDIIRDAAGNFSRNSYAYSTFVHEIGHSLGLKHPGNYNGSSTGQETPPFLPLAEDNYKYSLMSYNLSGKDSNGDDREPYTGAGPIYPSTPLIYDIAAIQYLYGANLNTRSGNTIYGDGNNTGNPAYTWNSDNAFIAAIWDAGGNDTISAANQILGTVIDLTVNINGQPIHFSSIGPRSDSRSDRATNNLAIAFGVTIENAIGGSGNDELIGNVVANVLNGGIGRDTMRGGQDNDTYYVDNVGDNVIELANEGTADIVYSSLFSYTLSDNVENLTLIDSSTRGTGNGLVNVITGNDRDNLLDGKEGNDTLYGGGEDDKLTGGIGADLLDGGIGSDTTSYSTSSAGVTVNLTTGQITGGDATGDILQSIEYLEGSELRDILTGDSQNNRLWGLGGDDILDGGLGDDSMFGGKDNDEYYVDSINDTVTEYANEGIDRVFSSVTYTLKENVENLTLTGNSIINGTGNSLSNTITGNESDNYLYGLDGDDTLIGGGGSDILDGGLGADSLFGGLGNDNYYVDNINDIITEYANQGNDNVFSSVTYRLEDDLENLTLTGNSIINGTGNSLGNIITGNDASNTLDGKAGNDFLYGNAGNDTILGDDGDDKLIGGLGADILNGGNGIDFASYLTATNGVTASLSASQNNTGDAQGDIYQFIENLEGSEFGDSLFGDNQSNILIGLGGDDFLDGFGGNDILLGGKGSDTYKVYSAGDVVTEYANEGIDTVNAAVNYILAANSNLENLNLIEGTAAFDGTGNELSNIINGNSFKNIIDGGVGDDHLFGFAGGDTLTGGDGSDWLTGGQGNDILTGGNGNDYFAYNSITDAGDRITDFTVGSDKIVLTEVVNSSGFRSFNPLADGFFGVRSAGSSMAAIMIDPDGAAGGSFRPAPFLLLNNVSASALNNFSNFVF